MLDKLAARECGQDWRCKDRHMEDQMKKPANQRLSNNFRRFDAKDLHICCLEIKKILQNQ